MTKKLGLDTSQAAHAQTCPKPKSADTQQAAALQTDDAAEGLASGLLASP